MAPSKKVRLKLAAQPSKSKRQGRDKSHKATNRAKEGTANWHSEITKEGLPELLPKMRNSIRRLRNGYQAALREAVAKCVLVANLLKDNRKEWRTFCASPAWENVKARPNEQDIGKALHYILRWTFGVDKNGSQRASLYGRAIKPLLDGGADPRDLPELIKEKHGFNELIKATKAQGDDPDDGDSDEEEGLETDDLFDTEKRPRIRSNAPSRPTSAGHTKSKSAAPSDDDDADDGQSAKKSGKHSNFDVICKVPTTLAIMRMWNAGKKARLTADVRNVSDSVVTIEVIEASAE